MTLAVAKALLLYGTITDMDAFKWELVRVMHKVGIALSYLDLDLLDIAEEFERRFVLPNSHK